jgi:hypothetical protein
LAAISFLTVSGVAATRVSPGRVSAGMPIFMGISQKESRNITRNLQNGTTVPF